MPKDLPILTLVDAAAWRNWLAREGSSSDGVMLATMKKGAKGTVTNLRYGQALDEALCYGWIDSGGRRVDDSIYLFRFGPRKADSLWSMRNIGYVERLESENRIRPAGRATIERAKANGRWNSAYSGSGDTEMPPEFIAALDKVPAAKATWDLLNKGNRWRIYFRLNNLKTIAGREKRIRTDIEMLARGEMPTPQKQRTVHIEENMMKEASRASVMDANYEHAQPSLPSRRTKTGRIILSYVE